MRATGRAQVVALSVAGVVLGVLLSGCAHSDPYRDYTAPGAVPAGPDRPVAFAPSSGSAPLSAPVQRTAHGTSVAPNVVSGPAGGAPQVGTAPAAPPPPSQATPPRGRPMTPWQRLYRQQCQSGRQLAGCKFFTDFALQLQGIDPNSGTPQP